jgi:hypothetical protein
MTRVGAWYSDPWLQVRCMCVQLSNAVHCNGNVLHNQDDMRKGTVIADESLLRCSKLYLQVDVRMKLTLSDVT